MKCPHCREPDLLMTTREGIEIDYCPQCRGIWLDRGELDKILERSVAEMSEPRYAEPRYKEEKYREEKYRDERSKYDRDDYYKHRKPKSFWKELFDF